jgi:RNA polymerase sigma factor (sigma-70 family)
MTFSDSAFCNEWATTLARILWEPLLDDTFVELLELVPSPDAVLVPTIAAELLSRTPNYRIYTEDQCRRLLTAMSVIVVTSLVKEFARRVAACETAVDRGVRQWMARGEPTSEELEALVQQGQRRRVNPDGKEDTDSIYRAALAERVPDALQEHFAASLDEQFRHMLDGFFGRVAWRADNSVRDVLRREVLRRQREPGVDLEPLTDIVASTNYRTHGFRVEWAEEPDRTILLAELRACPLLTDRERQVIDLRLQELTQVAIAKTLGISQPRVAQLERKAIAKMREHSKARS